MFRVPSISGLFKWRQFEPEVILLAVGWYLRFSLSYRDVEELLPSGACTPITLRRGDGSSVTPRKSNDVYAQRLKPTNNSRRWTKPTSGSRASGVTFIVWWILPARPSTFFSGRAGRGRSKALHWPKRSDSITIPYRASLTPTA